MGGGIRHCVDKPRPRAGDTGTNQTEGDRLGHVIRRPLVTTVCQHVSAALASGAVADEKDTATLYVRGVPPELVRAAKATAARRGMTLTALVIEALGHAVGAGRGDERPPEPDLQADQAWFAANRRDLEERYPGQYVAVVDGEVVDHDPEFAPLARRVLAQFGPRPVLMPCCVPDGRVVHLPSPRVQRS